MTADVMKFPPLPYRDEVEFVPLDEAADTESVLELIRVCQRQNSQACGKLQRDVHVKSHGSAVGQFRVLDGLPSELAQGLFARPATYPAFVRFSSTSPVPRPDALPDGRGLAIQVQNVTGVFLDPSSAPGMQEFVMVNAPAFPARDVKDYLRLQTARLETGRHPVRGAFHAVTEGQWNPLEWKWREAANAAQTVLQPFAHPAAYTYYSMAPIRYGDYVAKYRVSPASDLRQFFVLATAVRCGLQPNAMRQMLTETLRHSQLRFHFEVQLRNDERSMPIEDASIEWPKNRSPYRSVALLTLLAQDNVMSFIEGERREFSVWHALAAHRPLGGINRCRRQAYAVSAAYRRQGTAPMDPGP